MPGAAEGRPGQLTCQLLSCLAATGKNGSPLLGCTGCRYVAYCCKDHQKLDWSLHKHFCKSAGKVGPLAPVIPMDEWMTEGMNNEQRGRWNAASQEIANILKMQVADPAQHSAAVARTKAVLSNLEASFGRGHLGTVCALQSVAILYMNRAMFDDALSFTLRVLKIVDDRFGPEDVKNKSFLSTYTHVLRGLGRQEDSLIQFQRCLRLTEAAYGLNSEATAIGIGDVALALSDLGRVDEAVTLIRRSLAILTALQGAASRSGDIIKIRTNLAAMLGQIDRFEEAQPLFEDALKAADGRNGIMLARISASYAAAMRRAGQGDLSMIVNMLEHTLRVLEDAHGEVNLEFIAHLDQCAQANADLGRWRRAAELMQRCATLTSDEFGPGHARTKEARELAARYKSRR